jgi:hypothetical protein
MATMITFTYEFSDILNNSQIIASYRSSANTQRDNKVLVDDADATFEDESILTKYLKAAAGKIAGVMSGYTTNLFDIDPLTLLPKTDTDGNYIVLDALEFVAAVTAYPDHEPPIVAVTPKIILRINVPANFRVQSVTTLDESIKDALENYILYRLNKHKGHDWESFFDDYNQAIGDVLMYLNQRSTVTTINPTTGVETTILSTTRRSYRMF